MLAGRYLKLLNARGRGLHQLTLVVAFVALALHVAALWSVRRHMGLSLVNPLWRQFFQWARPLSLLALVLVGFFIALVRRLNIFSTISTYGLFLGTGAMVVVLSVMSGFEKDLKRKILGANAHIVVSAPDRAFTDYRDVRKKLEGVPDVLAISPFISNEVMISSQSNLSGVIVKGIEPASVGSVTDLSRNMEQGELDSLNHPEKLEANVPIFPDERKDKDAPKDKEAPKDTLRPVDGDGKAVTEAPPAPHRVLPGVIIGRELAKNLRVYLYDDVNVISPMGDVGPAGTMPRSRPFRVAGTFYSGMYEYDSKYIYMSIPAAQRFLGLDDEVTGFELKVRDPDRTEGPLEEIKRRLGAGYEVQDWKELNRHLFSALKVEQVAMFVVLCFVILVASFSIVANGIMLVQEKRREIAILKSMGISDGAVLRTFLFIGLFIGSIGTVMGIVTGVAACIGLRYFEVEISSDVFYISKLPVEMSPYEIASVLGAALLIALVAILYPALLAARLRPVDGLRQEHG
jgi:lipoprotein-releasing system permease protein